MKHTFEELKVIDAYHDAIDLDILEYITNVVKGETLKPITVGFLPENAANEIEELTGKIVYGNRIVLDYNGVKHILKRHGLNGQQDQSMSNMEDFARIGYVLANYDKIEFHNEYAQGYVDKDGNLAPKIIISKKIDGTFYVIEAVSDSKMHRNYVVSAYIKSRSNESDIISP